MNWPPLSHRASRLLLISLLASLSLSVLADALDSWTGQTIFTNTIALRAAAFGNGRYVVGGDGSTTPDLGSILTSDDGLLWTLRRDGSKDASDQLGEILSLAYGLGVFVGVGYPGRIYSSADAITWVLRQQAPFYNFMGVVKGPTRFVAVGDGQLMTGGTTTNNIYTSSDGITWTARRSGADGDPNCRIYCVAYGNGAFVALGAGNSVPSTAFRSTTGTTWTRTVPSAFFYIDHLDFCNGLFFAAAGVGTNLVSLDGITWSVRTNDSHVNFQKILFAHGIYVGLGHSANPADPNAFLTSTNGTNWTSRAFPVSPQLNIRGFTTGDRRVIAFGDRSSANSIYTSGPLIDLSVNPVAPPSLNISGLVGASYRVEYATNLVPGGSTSWQALSNFSLQGSPTMIADGQAAGASKRFYRAVLLP
jgi:hypothetical protein